MKSNLFLIGTVIVLGTLLAFGFKADAPQKHALDETIKAEFVAETTSDLLKANLANLYSDEFDQVFAVDIHQDETSSFYYVAYGWKAGKAVTDLINISEEYAAQEYYPNRADLGIGENEAIIPCHCKGNDCKHFGSGRKCGVATDEGIPCTPGVCPQIIIIIKKPFK